MARINDLEVSPAHQEDTSEQIFRTRVLSKTNNEDRTNDGENGEISTGTEDDNVRQKDTESASGELREQQDDDDAEGLAGLINGVLSGPTQSGSKSAPKASKLSGSKAVKAGMGRSISSSQKQSKSLRGNDTTLAGSVQAQVHGNTLQILAEEVSDNTNAFNGDKSNAGKILARPSAIFEDISKVQKSRSSGRPDPYDVPQSPPTSLDTEPSPRVPQRQAPELEQLAFFERPKKAAAVFGEAGPSTKRNSVDPQERVEHIETSPDYASFAPEERTATSKRATRSMHIKEYDLSDIKKGRERRQRKDFTEMQEPRETSHAEFGSISSKEDQSGEIQAGTSTGEYLESRNVTIGSLGREPQWKDTTPEAGRGDPRPRENPDLTPTNGRQDAEKASFGGSAQGDSQGISPILSAPTPIQKTQIPSRKLPRPSITSNGTQNPKRNISTRQTTRGLVVKTREIAQEEACHDEYDSEQDPQTFIDKATLNSLSSTIRMAGRNIKDVKVIKDDKIHFIISQTLCKATRRLADKYQAMSSLLTAIVVDVGEHEKEHAKAKRCLERIEIETKNLLRDRLGDPGRGNFNADEDARTHVLEDIYLHVVPCLVKALKAAAKSHQNRVIPATSDLEEFLSLLKILYDLVAAAISEDKSLQPKAPRNNSHSISQPTRRMWPTLQKLYKKCKIELADREAAKKLEKSQQRAPEKIRKRKEQIEAEEQAAEEEYRRRQKNRNREIVDSLNERRAELGLPPCTQQDKTSPERLTGVFGRKNTHPGTTPKDWTKMEMEILVDGLRRERGPTRYEKLATRLERTLDEIFERAKYLKMQIEYTLKRLQEEYPDKEFPIIKPWVENIGSEGFLNQ